MVLPSEYQKWSVASIHPLFLPVVSPVLRYSARRIGGESVASPPVTFFQYLPVKTARSGWTGGKYRFSSLWHHPTENRTPVIHCATYPVSISVDALNH